jgi:hypothetical protein
LTLRGNVDTTLYPVGEERGHKEMAFVHTKVRNRLSDERMNKLVYIRMNLQTMEDKAIENWGDAEVFNLDDGDDNEVRNVGEEMGRLDICMVGCRGRCINNR